MKRLIAAGAAALGLCLAGQAFAAPATGPLPAGGLTPQEVAHWLQEEGYSGLVKPDSARPGEFIVSSTADGVNYDIYLYGCDQGRCRSIQYAAGWTKPEHFGAPEINKWNTDNRYLRVYVSASGDVWGEMDVDIDPGGTYAQLDGSLHRWRSTITSFKTEVEK